jgi:LAO/AO transport system kinase
MAKIISMVEDNVERPQIMRAVYPRTGSTLVTGITGPPGAGKSSLVEALTKLFREQEETVGIVAVDPTSPLTGGAILGDRIRMQSHATDRGVFIRSMGTRGNLGGMASATADVMRIMEAGGYSTLLLETVGVGQSEIEIMHLADTVVVILNTGTGDGIQAIKAGIMEIADIFVINKADLPGAQRMKKDIEMMLGMTGTVLDWKPPVVLTSVYENSGISQLQAEICSHQTYLRTSGLWKHKRQEQLQREVWRHLNEQIQERFIRLWPKLPTDWVIAGGTDPSQLAGRLWSVMIGEMEVKDNV